MASLGAVATLFVEATDTSLRSRNAEEVRLLNARTQLYNGAHIATGTGRGPYHHGIVTNMNENITIIHFFGPDKRHASIRECNLEQFLAGNDDSSSKTFRRRQLGFLAGVEGDVRGVNLRPLYLIHYEYDNETARQATVTRAIDNLEQENPITYDLVSHNCESFATYCRTLQWESEQVNIMIRDAIAPTVTAGVILTGSVAFISVMLARRS
ncbi:unnamed protein product [Didymodactylos carnosus]|uniref:LRAT domain-containing protein n=1 Tax=Didymodactylos carnosus TaxID=1234261 RepID=A0A815EXZ6_9BILA|nr:unnamed protein product [Didymodactylos carnosus]CAF1317665.1 unnamed protein product [Didymodactylos carnosus]CAF3858376.1 unnamed protein product [Didymodactylos carnosus]CAF4160955.1 unnamed protein product [Didymodactylos carnosus]